MKHIKKVSFVIIMLLMTIIPISAENIEEYEFSHIKISTINKLADKLLEDNKLESMTFFDNTDSINSYIEKSLIAYNHLLDKFYENSPEIALYVTDVYLEETIAEFSNSVFTKNQYGKNGLGNAILITLALDKGEYYVTYGNGLEKEMSDVATRDITANGFGVKFNSARYRSPKGNYEAYNDVIPIIINNIFNIMARKIPNEGLLEIQAYVKEMTGDSIYAVEKTSKESSFDGSFKVKTMTTIGLFAILFMALPAYAFFLEFKENHEISKDNKLIEELLNNYKDTENYADMKKILRPSITYQGISLTGFYKYFESEDYKIHHKAKAIAKIEQDLFTKDEKKEMLMLTLNETNLNVVEIIQNLNNLKDNNGELEVIVTKNDKEKIFNLTKKSIAKAMDISDPYQITLEEATTLIESRTTWDMILRDAVKDKRSTNVSDDTIKDWFSIDEYVTDDIQVSIKVTVK